MQIENEPGVHGGEYPVRPNMQESMVFLKKLFSHQQEGSQFTSLLSPPDNPYYSDTPHPVGKILFFVIMVAALVHTFSNFV